MKKEYMSVRAVAEAAGVSVQAVYKWIEQKRIPAESVPVSESEARYRIPRRAAQSFLHKNHRRARPATIKVARARKNPPTRKPAAKKRTGAMLLEDLRKSGFIGLWKDRTDLGDSLEFARELRRRAEQRNHD